MELGTPIKKYIFGSRTGPLDGLLWPAMKVWYLDVGLRPGCRSGFC